MHTYQYTYRRVYIYMHIVSYIYIYIYEDMCPGFRIQVQTKKPHANCAPDRRSLPVRHVQLPTSVTQLGPKAWACHLRHPLVINGGSLMVVLRWFHGSYPLVNRHKHTKHYGIIMEKSTIVNGKTHVLSMAMSIG